MSAVNIRVASWSTHHRRSVSTVRRWSIWQSINWRAASSPIVHVGGHEISFAGQNVRRMHSAKPFFFLLEVILFVKNILLSVSFAHSRSLLKLKFNTQTVTLCTLIESSMGGPCVMFLNASGFAFIYARNLGFYIESRGCFRPLSNFHHATLYDLGWSAVVNGNNTEIESTWTMMIGIEFFLGSFCYIWLRDTCVMKSLRRIFLYIILSVNSQLMMFRIANLIMFPFAQLSVWCFYDVRHYAYII